jgi:hypothetical protein
MLAKDGNGPTDFKNGNKNGWPARRKEPSKTTKRTRKDIPQKKRNLTMQWEK